MYYHYRKRQVDGTWRQPDRALRKKERTDRDHDPEPTGAIIDSQSVETTGSGGESCDAGKGVWGPDRHVIVDTVGNVLDVAVRSADIQDRDGARLLFERLWEQTCKRVQKIWADGAYKGDLVDWVQDSLDAVLDVAHREEDIEKKIKTGLRYCQDAGHKDARSPGLADTAGSAKTMSDALAVARG